MKKIIGILIIISTLFSCNYAQQDNTPMIENETEELNSILEYEKSKHELTKKDMQFLEQYRIMIDTLTLEQRSNHFKKKIKGYFAFLENREEVISLTDSSLSKIIYALPGDASIRYVVLSSTFEASVSMYEKKIHEVASNCYCAQITKSDLLSLAIVRKRVERSGDMFVEFLDTEVKPFLR